MNIYVPDVHSERFLIYKHNFDHYYYYHADTIIHTHHTHTTVRATVQPQPQGNIRRDLLYSRTYCNPIYDDTVILFFMTNMNL